MFFQPSNFVFFLRYSKGYEIPPIQDLTYSKGYEIPTIQHLIYSKGYEIPTIQYLSVFFC
jgi:hypothetical protein